MTLPVPQDVISRTWWLEFGFAIFSTVILGATIALGGDPAVVVAAAVACVAIVALMFRHASLLAAAICFAILVAAVEGFAQPGVDVVFNSGPVVAVFALFGIIGLVETTHRFHEETGVPLHLSFWAVFPIGRLIGFASALWVLTNPAVPAVAAFANEIGLRATAILALVVPVVVSEVIKFLLKPLYVGQVKN